METLAFLVLDSLQSKTLEVLFIIAGISAAYCFIVGELTRNNSQMDKLWSVLPAVYAWVAAGAGILNWTACGAVLLILLFMGSSTLGEYISKSKYPEYADYVKTVNRFFPGRPYRG